LVNNKTEKVDVELGNKKKADERENSQSSKETEEDKEEKEKNGIFWIQYGYERAVGVKTHYFEEGFKRLYPFITVRDLITMFKNISDSPLTNVSTGNITLHVTENGTVKEMPLERSQKLSSIPLALGRTFENPLVIKNGMCLCFHICYYIFIY